MPCDPKRAIPGSWRPVLKKSSEQRALTTNDDKQRKPFSLFRRAFLAFGLVSATPRTESGDKSGVQRVRVQLTCR